jgi:hypothetical protein
MTELTARQQWKLVLCGSVLALVSHSTPMPWALPIYIAALSCICRSLFVGVVATEKKP